jgi:hypothetical protein
MENAEFLKQNQMNKKESVLWVFIKKILSKGFGASTKSMVLDKIKKDVKSEYS